LASVTFSHITKEYITRRQTHRAVCDLNLHVKDGSFAVLVGPSGCGKSTTLRMVAGLEHPDEGSILIDDRVVNDVAPRDRDVAMVFQNYALYPHMTAHDNMACALKMRGVPRREISRRVTDAASLLGLTDLLHRKPAALSGGERQRVAVGRAIVREPRVFLFDEPLSNLDAQLRTHTRTELKALYQRIGTTTIYVTHDQEEAMTLGDRLVVMKDGVIQQDGAPLEIYDRPANRFVAGFIGRPAMNFLEGRLRHGSDVTEFVGPGGMAIALPRSPVNTGHNGAEVVLGVRPEHLRVTEPTASTKATGGSQRLRLDVSVVEPLGDRLNVHGTTAGGQPIVVQLAGRTRVAVGESLSLTMDAGDVFLFSADAEGRLLTRLED